MEPTIKESTRESSFFWVTCCIFTFPIPFLFFHVWLLAFHSPSIFQDLFTYIFIFSTCIWTLIWYMHHFWAERHTLRLCRQAEYELQTWEAQYTHFKRGQLKNRYTSPGASL
jgi:hypothetical protein